LAYVRRAVREYQKLRRRAEILAAAWRLFEGRPFGGITVGEVAWEAGLAKGTIYLYFATKEELFLGALERQLGGWLDHVDGRLRGMGGCGVPEVVALLCGSLEERPALARALAIMHGVLEQNVGPEALVRFKGTLHSRLENTGALLEGCLPGLAGGDGLKALLRAHALIVGLWQLADPPAAGRRAIEEGGLEGFRVDFAREFSESMEALLRGMQSGTKGGSG
jgi:AcrR family transcriptional regulator